VDDKKEILIQGDDQLSIIFLPLLEKGANLDVVVGGTLRQLLFDQVGIEHAYIDDRIQTIFLNAKAIDDVDQTVIHDGDVLALSGAMPGLVGATLRKGGKYAALRKEISGTQMASSSRHIQGKIRLKLFNTVLKNIGPKVLLKGVEILGTDLIDLLKQGEKELKANKARLFVRDKEISIPEAISNISKQDQCQIRVIITDYLTLYK